MASETRVAMQARRKRERVRKSEKKEEEKEEKGIRCQEKGGETAVELSKVNEERSERELKNVQVREGKTKFIWLWERRH